MNRNECKVWMNYHFSIFPAFRDWWHAQTKEARALMYEGYVKAFKAIELNDAKEATDSILSGAAKKPWEHQDTISVIIKASWAIRKARTPAPTRVDGQETFSCANCHDTGWIEHEYKQNDPQLRYELADGEHFYSTICQCSHGDKHRGLPWGSGAAHKSYA